MKKIIFSILMFAFLLMIVPVAPAADDPGKTAFVDQKCNMCHGVEAAGIVKKSKGGPPDLSSVGIDHNADWLAKYLKKEEAVSGKKHAKEFAGKDADLQAIAKWLETLKTKK